ARGARGGAFHQVLAGGSERCEARTDLRAVAARVGAPPAGVATSPLWHGVQGPHVADGFGSALELARRDVSHVFGGSFESEASRGARERAAHRTDQPQAQERVEHHAHAQRDEREASRETGSLEEIAGDAVHDRNLPAGRTDREELTGATCSAGHPCPSLSERFARSLAAR